jgi:hypothetical protein
MQAARVPGQQTGADVTGTASRCLVHPRGFIIPTGFPFNAHQTMTLDSSALAAFGSFPRAPSLQGCSPTPPRAKKVVEQGMTDVFQGGRQLWAPDAPPLLQSTVPEFGVSSGLPRLGTTTVSTNSASSCASPKPIHFGSYPVSQHNATTPLSAAKSVPVTTATRVGVSASGDASFNYSGISPIQGRHAIGGIQLTPVSQFNAPGSFGSGGSSSAKDDFSSSRELTQLHTRNYYGNNPIPSRELEQATARADGEPTTPSSTEPPVDESMALSFVLVASPTPFASTGSSNSTQVLTTDAKQKTDDSTPPQPKETSQAVRPQGEVSEAESPCNGRLALRMVDSTPTEDVVPEEGNVPESQAPTNTLPAEENRQQIAQPLKSALKASKWPVEASAVAPPVYNRPRSATPTPTPTPDRVDDDDEWFGSREPKEEKDILLGADISFFVAVEDSIVIPSTTNSTAANSTWKPKHTETKNHAASAQDSKAIVPPHPPQAAELIETVPEQVKSEPEKTMPETFSSQNSSANVHQKSAPQDLTPVQPSPEGATSAPPGSRLDDVADDEEVPVRWSRKRARQGEPPAESVGGRPATAEDARTPVAVPSADHGKYQPTTTPITSTPILSLHQWNNVLGASIILDGDNSEELKRTSTVVQPLPVTSSEQLPVPVQTEEEAEEMLPKYNARARKVGEKEASGTQHTADRDSVESSATRSHSKPTADPEPAQASVQAWQQILEKAKRSDEQTSLHLPRPIASTSTSDDESKGDFGLLPKFQTRYAKPTSTPIAEHSSAAAGKMADPESSPVVSGRPSAGRLSREAFASIKVHVEAIKQQRTSSTRVTPLKPRTVNDVEPTAVVAPSPSLVPGYNEGSRGQENRPARSATAEKNQKKFSQSQSLSRSRAEEENGDQSRDSDSEAFLEAEYAIPERTCHRNTAFPSCFKSKPLATSDEDNDDDVDDVTTPSSQPSAGAKHIGAKHIGSDASLEAKLASRKAQHRSLMSLLRSGGFPAEE